MSQVTQGLLSLPQQEVNDLRKRLRLIIEIEKSYNHQIAILEQKWTADVESGRRTAEVRTQEGNQYRIANPSPLGLFAFGYTAMLFMGPHTQWTEAGTNQLGFACSLFLGGLTLLLVSMWEIYRNNMFGGTVFGFYGGLWLSYGILGVLVGGQVLESPATYEHGRQMFTILWGIVTFIFFIATLAISITLQILFFSLMVTFFLLAASISTNKNVEIAGGYFGIWTGGWAFYIGAAELLNNVYRRQVLPLGIINHEVKEPDLSGTPRPDTL